MANMQDAVDNLAPALQHSLQHGISASFSQLISLLCEGKPLSPAAIAVRLGKPYEEIQARLHELPCLEWNAEGYVVGAGITLHPTPHHFELNGHLLYTWCALDTLFYPVLLGKTAHVVSSCHSTGSLIRLSITPTAVVSLDPPEAVISLVTPPAHRDIRASFCNHVHFFQSRDVATAWLARGPQATIVPIAEAFELGRTFALSINLSSSDLCTCTPTVPRS